jgi:hypothetical protein
MKSPISRTLGRLVSLASEIQMSHHSMNSRENGGIPAGAASPAAIRQVMNVTVRKNLHMVFDALLILFIDSLLATVSAGKNFEKH